MPDVGDGLAMSVTVSEPEESMQIDWGGYTGTPNVKPQEAYEAHERFWGPEPTTFVLSHFHFDHYKGLTYAAHEADVRDQFEFEKACYPRLPKFEADLEDSITRRELALAFQALSLLDALTVFGEESGLPLYDYLSAADKVSRIPVKRNPLYRKKRFDCGGDVFEVLWPPKRLSKQDAPSSIENANDAIDELKNDKVFKIIYSVLRESGLIEEMSAGRRDLDGEEIEEYRSNRRVSEVLGEIGKKIEKLGPDREYEFTFPRGNKKARKKIRDAADDLSLIFRHEKNSFLFFGDHNPERLRKISNKLERRRETHYSVLISSHHGTRINNRRKHGMADILSADLALSSVGDRLKDGLQPLYSKLSRLHLTTYGNGDIHAGNWGFSNFTI